MKPTEKEAILSYQELKEKAKAAKGAAHRRLIKEAQQSLIWVLKNVRVEDFKDPKDYKQIILARNCWNKWVEMAKIGYNPAKEIDKAVAIMVAA